MVKKENSIFVELLGNYPFIRILNHLLIFREFDYSLTDIARNSGVAWSTLNLLWPRLEKSGVVLNTRNVGKAKMYRLNEKNAYAKKLREFADALAWERARSKIRKPKAVAR